MCLRGGNARQFLNWTLDACRFPRSGLVVYKCSYAPNVGSECPHGYLVLDVSVHFVGDLRTCQFAFTSTFTFLSVYVRPHGFKDGGTVSCTHIDA